MRLFVPIHCFLCERLIPDDEIDPTPWNKKGQEEQIFSHARCFHKYNIEKKYFPNGDMLFFINKFTTGRLVFTGGD